MVDRTWLENSLKHYENDLEQELSKNKAYREFYDRYVRRCCSLRSRIRELKAKIEKIDIEKVDIEEETV